MSFRQRLLAYSTLAAAAFAASPATMAGEVKLDYRSLPADSAEMTEYWSDLQDLAVQYGDLPTEVFVAEFEAPDGTLTVTMLGAMGACGLNECPIRIFKDGEKIADFNGCYNHQTHAINETGSLFLACDDVIPVGRP